MFHHVTSHHRLTPRAMDNKQHLACSMVNCCHHVHTKCSALWKNLAPLENDPCSANCVRTCFDEFRKDGRFDPTGGQKESHSACVELQEPVKQTVLHKPGDEPSFLLWHPPTKRLDGLAKRFLCGVVTPQDLCPKERNWSLEDLFIVPRVLRFIFAMVLLSRSFHDMGSTLRCHVGFARLTTREVVIGRRKGNLGRVLRAVADPVWLETRTDAHQHSEMIV